MAKEEIKNTENMDLDWDDGISAEAGEGEYPAVLPVGEYDFRIIDWEKTFSKSGKNMAKLTLGITYKDFEYKVWDYLVLSSNMAWKLATFFESLGLKKKGTELKKMPWNKVAGAHGRVKIKHEEYNGQPSAKVDKYIATIASQADSAPDPSDMPFEV